MGGQRKLLAFKSVGQGAFGAKFPKVVADAAVGSTMVTTNTRLGQARPGVEVSRAEWDEGQASERPPVTTESQEDV
jgi:hypothetical protein